MAFQVVEDVSKIISACANRGGWGAKNAARQLEICQFLNGDGNLAQIMSEHDEPPATTAANYRASIRSAGLEDRVHIKQKFGIVYMVRGPKPVKRGEGVTILL